MRLMINPAGKFAALLEVSSAIDFRVLSSKGRDPAMSAVVESISGRLRISVRALRNSTRLANGAECFSAALTTLGLRDFILRIIAFMSESSPDFLFA